MYAVPLKNSARICGEDNIDGCFRNKSQEDKEDHVKELAEKFLNDWEFNTCNDGAVTIVVANEKIASSCLVVSLFQ